jgi:hypothetical protein
MGGVRILEGGGGKQGGAVRGARESDTAGWVFSFTKKKVGFWLSADTSPRSIPALAGELGNHAPIPPHTCVLCAHVIYVPFQLRFVNYSN